MADFPGCGVFLFFFFWDGFSRENEVCVFCLGGKENEGGNCTHNRPPTRC